MGHHLKDGVFVSDRFALPPAHVALNLAKPRAWRPAALLAMEYLPHDAEFAADLIADLENRGCHVRLFIDFLESKGFSVATYP